MNIKYPRLRQQPTTALEATKLSPKITKLSPKIHQVGLQKPPSWAPNSRKIRLGGSLEESWGHLGVGLSKKSSALQKSPRHFRKVVDLSKEVDRSHQTLTVLKKVDPS